MSMTIHHDLSAALGPVRNQGQRPTCVAFAMSDLSRYYAKSEILSAEYLYQSAAQNTPGWTSTSGTNIAQAVAVTAAPGLPHEAFFPYQPTQPIPPIPALPVPTPPDALHSTTFANGIIAGAAYVKTRLAAGHPVGLVIKLTLDFHRPTEGMVAYTTKVIPNQRHAVVATGYGTHDESAEDYIRIRNSWGTGWGDQGHAWLHVKYIENHTVTAFRI
ncbi:C1 family peptidase [Burkholderia glumae]|uniref:C1 family peptidase n=1 Tax=Burkholderia glumae TaxID=337 RepID=UPI0021516545|nr:C1 family peptidase [Burkholderia glumae]